MKKRSLNMSSVLLLTLIGTAVLVLACAVLLFFRTYQSSLLQNAATNSQRAVAQVSNTVNDYLDDVDKIMSVFSAFRSE